MKVLNTLIEIDLKLCTKAFVGDDNFKTPPPWKKMVTCFAQV